MQHQDLGVLELEAGNTKGNVPAEVIATWPKLPRESCYSFVTRTEVCCMVCHVSSSSLVLHDLSSPTASLYGEAIYDDTKT